jgi:class 3 adenylate cyclase/tetratricopeptide (TPR) repeat protein
MESWTCTACGGDNAQGMRFCGHCGAASGPTPTAEPDTREQDVADALKSFVSGPVAERLLESGGKLQEERRLITALFADVSGFTSLADRLDPEDLLEVIDPVISGLSSIVGRYGGYVEKFAGDALMALFGAPISHDDDAERALRVALQMHAELARLVEELPHDAKLTLHVGVNSGHGIARILGSEARMDYAVLGDSVILAQRLEAAAPPGETYLSETTARLTEGKFELEPVGELTLKGKSEPVSAWRLVGERRAVPKRLSRLIGRERELEDVEKTLRSLAHRSGGIVGVVGEAGVGKSRLTESTREDAGALGIRWLQTRCLSYGGGLAYWPYAELLRQEEHADVTRSIPHFARLTGLPEGAALAGLEPAAFQRGLHTAFAEWLQGLARERPTVLALEDVHWADSSSISLTRDLVRLAAVEPLGFYLIGRPESAPLLEELTQDLQSTRVDLTPLDEEGTAELIDSMLGAPGPRELSPFVAARTAGNPFFIQELVRALQDSGMLLAEQGTWTTRPGWDARELPPTIEGVLAARIDLLPRTAATVLGTASVIGRRIPLTLLRAVVDDPADLEASVEALVGTGLLDPLTDDGDRHVTFHHALVQDVAYSRLLRRRRQEIHRKVADTAERLYGAGDDVIDLLARHLYLGRAGEKAVGYLRRAGERSRLMFANEEAILHFERAVELAPDDPDLRLQLADLDELVGRYDEAQELYRQLRDTTSNVGAWRGLASTLRKQGAYKESLDVVNEALRTSALIHADLVPLWIENSWTLAVSGHYDQAIDVLLAGLASIGSREDALVGRLLLELSVSEMFTGRLAEALEHGLRAQRILEEHDDAVGLTKAMRVVGGVYHEQDRLDDAAETLRRGVQLAERVGSVEELGGCLINLGLVELKRGALDDAIACDNQAIEEFERVGHGSGRAIGYANLAEKLTVKGDYTAALATAEHALELARSIGLSYTIADLTKTTATIHLRQGDLAEAAARAEEAAALFIEVGATPSAVEALAVAAEAWDQAGETERAADTAARSLTLSGSV